MTEIKVDTHLLQTKAEMVRRYRQQHMETMGRLKKLIFSLNETWKGEAQDAFIASYQSSLRSRSLMQCYIITINS